MTSDNPSRAGSASAPAPASAAPPKLQPGPSAYHESSQFKHWRFSHAALAGLRRELNEKCKEVTKRNMEAEKAAQESLGTTLPDPPRAAAYLSVEDELLLVRFYCSHASAICRNGFGLPEVVEATAISYIKRFYLKNSVMEWHPKNIMPTCLFLASKTTNHPVPIDTFIAKLKGFQASDVLDLEFLVAQSLSFEFWVHGGDKALRGWGLELQDQPRPPRDAIQCALPKALEMLTVSRYTDAEFVYAPGQVALACWRMSNRELVDGFLEWKYAAAAAAAGGAGGEDGVDGEAAETPAAALPYGIALDGLKAILVEIEELVATAPQDGKFDIKTIKEVDKRLKGCTNPEKVPGTALYIKRKAEQEAKAAEAKAEKSRKAAAVRAVDELVFGGDLKKPDGFGGPLGEK